jgi:nitrogen fixation-related uncharacterized protein
MFDNTQNPAAEVLYDHAVLPKQNKSETANKTG